MIAMALIVGVLGLAAATIVKILCDANKSRKEWGRK